MGLSHDFRNVLQCIQRVPRGLAKGVHLGEDM